jgi:hypothetical protein
MELDKMKNLFVFLKDHIRGISRIRSLGNSFQVDIVSYRISVVKAMILNGMDLVPLSSGIGEAEVLFTSFGTCMNMTFSIEKSKVNSSEDVSLARRR